MARSIYKSGWCYGRYVICYKDWIIITGRSYRDVISVLFLRPVMYCIVCYTDQSDRQETFNIIR